MLYGMVVALSLASAAVLLYSGISQGCPVLQNRRTADRLQNPRVDFVKALPQTGKALPTNTLLPASRTAIGSSAAVAAAQAKAQVMAAQLKKSKWDASSTRR